MSSKQNQLPEPVAGVSLRPNDPLAKRIASAGVESRNVLVKVTLPKRTGRKRKRGSDEPFAEPAQPARQSASITAPDLLRRLRDNEGKYEIEPVAVLRETHRFRTLPDFQLRATEIPMMRELRDHALQPSYDRLKRFHVDLTQGAYPGNIYPGPPCFTAFDMPYKYEYQQAAGVVYVEDNEGQVVTKNIAAPARRVTWGLPPDVDEVPQCPPKDLPSRNPNGEMLPRAIKELQKLLDERPLVTKRVALNAMPPISETIFKEATQYVGYSFKAGPWRDSLIRYGLDPRKDPKYRFYQTLMFQIDKEAFKAMPDDRSQILQSNETNTRWARPLRHTKADPTTHIFDGKNITANGKTWQVCDVTDPVVKKVFDTDVLPDICDVYQWGWYYNGTMAKGRAIMKDKMKYLFAGLEPPHEDYEVIASIADHLTKENVRVEAVPDSRFYNRNVVNLATELRSTVKAGDGARSSKYVWQNRLKKRVKRGSAEPGDVNVEDADEDVDLRELDVGDGDGDFDDNNDDDDA